MKYVYILKSFKDEQLYVGKTVDLKRRIKEHNTGKSFSTSFRLPFELIFYEAYKNDEDADARESSLKLRGNARRFLIKRIERSLR